MDKLTESLIKHLCPTCCGECDKGLVIIKTEDTIELHCPDYKPNRDKIKKLAYKDSKTITALKDGMYYECTYNGDKKELYFDAYKKFENKCIKLN